MTKDGTQNYIAEEIVGHAVMKKPGQHKAAQHYEVKWMRYEGTTWEPHDALMEDIPKMVKEYRRSRMHSRKLIGQT